MKVVFIYRKPRAGAYSIEELFHTIASELKGRVEVIEYNVGNRSKLFFDMLRLRQLDADIYHVTGDVNYLIPLLYGKKTVLTVHDIGHYLFGLSGIKRQLYKLLWLVLPIRNANAVTSVSLRTREHIIEQLGIKGKRIEVINNCHSVLVKPVTKMFEANRPVILQVGTKPYKNVPRLIEALKRLSCSLVLIGSLDNNIKKQLEECGISYENYVGITHEELYKEYIKCDIVSFISLGEGFGVPIIEAQAVGRPVITANIPPMCDVAGEGACLVDPLNVSQIRKGIERIIGEPVYRKQLVESGFRNVSRYSPATISRKYLALYESLMRT